MANSSQTNVQVIINAKDNASKVLKNFAGGVKKAGVDVGNLGRGLVALGA